MTVYLSFRRWLIYRDICAFCCVIIKVSGAETTVSFGHLFPASRQSRRLLLKTDAGLASHSPLQLFQFTREVRLGALPQLGGGGRTRSSGIAS